MNCQSQSSYVPTPTGRDRSDVTGSICGVTPYRSQYPDSSIDLASASLNSCPLYGLTGVLSSLVAFFVCRFERRFCLDIVNFDYKQLNGFVPFLFANASEETNQQRINYVTTYGLTHLEHFICNVWSFFLPVQMFESESLGQQQQQQDR